MELIKKLLALLKQIEESVYTTIEYSEDFYPSPELENTMNEIGSIAADINLSLNTVAQEVLMKNDYYIFPVGRDAFGWMVAGIRTSKGTIAY